MRPLHVTSVYLLLSLVFSMPNIDFCNLDKIFLYFFFFSMKTKQLLSCQTSFAPPKVQKTDPFHLLCRLIWVSCSKKLTHPEVTKKPHCVKADNLKDFMSFNKKCPLSIRLLITQAVEIELEDHPWTEDLSSSFRHFCSNLQ